MKAYKLHVMLSTLKGMLMSGTGGNSNRELEYSKMGGDGCCDGWHVATKDAMAGGISTPRLASPGKCSNDKKAGR